VLLVCKTVFQTPWPMPKVDQGRLVCKIDVHEKKEKPESEQENREVGYVSE